MHHGDSQERTLCTSRRFPLRNIQKGQCSHVPILDSAVSQTTKRPRSSGQITNPTGSNRDPANVRANHVQTTVCTHLVRPSGKSRTTIVRSALRGLVPGTLTIASQAAAPGQRAVTQEQNPSPEAHPAQAKDSPLSIHQGHHPKVHSQKQETFGSVLRISSWQLHLKRQRCP